MTDIEKIEKIQTYTGLSWKDLAAKIGLASPQVFTDIRGGRHGISFKLANKIIASMPEIRKEWLLADQEPMTYTETVKTIPLYDSPSELKLNSEKSLRTLNLDKCFSKAELAIVNSNDSMVEYPVGCIIMLKRVMSFELLVPGNNYLVETDEFTLIRRIQKCKDKTHIALYSSNMSTYPNGKMVYEPFEIPLDFVNRIFSILGYIYIQEDAKI